MISYGYELKHNLMNNSSNHGDDSHNDDKVPNELDKFFETQKHYLESKSPVQTIDEYVKLVRIITDYWETKVAWFRGHSKESYKLIPGIYRSEVWDYDLDEELGLEDEFIRLSRPFTNNNGDKLSRWEWYQIMQHHGVPTRLLDWTSASNVALYFAIRNLASINQPAVWVLDPYWLNERTTDQEDL